MLRVFKMPKEMQTMIVVNLESNHLFTDEYLRQIVLNQGEKRALEYVVSRIADYLVANVEDEVQKLAGDILNS